MTLSQKIASALVFMALIWPLIPMVDNQPVVTIKEIHYLYAQQFKKIAKPSFSEHLKAWIPMPAEQEPPPPVQAMITKSTVKPTLHRQTLTTPTFQAREWSLSSQAVYFWQQDGVWHFSNLKPNNHHETWILNPAENIVSLHSPELERVAAMGVKEGQPAQHPAQHPAQQIGVPSGLPYSQVGQLIENAKNIQKLADERARALESVAY